MNERYYILIVKVISFGNPDEQRFVSIFAHQLVEFLLDEIHFCKILIY